ncbi:MAG: SMP-30/gluconolactonase/LRE family protein [Anaerolineae bacterium]|nr:SMP-30/gluconolactonase/LRE family protein [Anaerolineae bacterium]
MEPRVIVDVDCATGEGPLWHPDERRLYWVDIPNGRLYRYMPTTGKHELVSNGPPIGGFTLQADGSLLLFMAKGAVGIWREGHDLEMVIDEIPAMRETRFNDVIADPAGRVFCGSMPRPDGPALLYRLDPDGTLTLVLDDVGLSNGLGFTPDRRGMYYTDTRKQKIYLFDYDESTGSVTNQRIFVDVPEREGEGHPDGMTVDAEGTIWSARWDGHCLVRYTAQGEEMQRVSFPVPKVSCVTFGGDDYTDMYVTTASVGHRETESPLAGSLFHLNLGIHGVPEFRSRIGLE